MAKMTKTKTFFSIFRFKSRLWRRRHVILSAIALSLVLLIAVNAFSSNQKKKNQNNERHSQNQNNLFVDSDDNNNNFNDNNDRQRQERRQQQRQHNQREEEEANEENAIPLLRVVHFDLKGAPPTIDFLAKLFPVLRSLGANAILIEYEDMFPFEGLLEGIKAKNSYSSEDINRLLSLAEKNSFEIIPLIQTFGHLEFALKLEPFSHLRELEEIPQAICPQNNDSWPFLKTMIDQMMKMHSKHGIKYLHIGCDEVFHLGLCSKCRLKERDRLFLDHVFRIAKYIVDTYHVIPIIWDDMLRQLSLESIKESGIASIGVEPMIWTYVREIYRFIPESQFMAYSQLFPYIWTASAFKGAFGETLTVPNIRMHLENQIAWLSTIQEQRHHFKGGIRGIVATGWQRYDHLATLCELFPSSIPSLALTLLTLKNGKFSPKQTFRLFDQLLHCSQHQSSSSSSLSSSYFAEESERALNIIESEDPNLFSRASSCQFPGSDVFRLMRSHLETIKALKDYIYSVTEHKAWLTLYNVRHNISSPFRVDEALQDFSTINYQMNSLLRNAKQSLTQVYDRFTVEEWIEQNIYPHLLQLETLMNNSIDLKRARFWPKRPIETTQDLKKRLEILN